MNSPERRVASRVNMRVTLRFRDLSNPGICEQVAESENISHKGLYFLTNYPLRVGTALDVYVRMPRELTGQPVNEIRYKARVVHVQPDSFLDRKKGIGLHIERCAAASVPRDRWAS